MMSKTEEELESDKDKNEEQIFMTELSKIASRIIPILKTEDDSPSNHPELNYKVPILDMYLLASRMEDDINHSKCREDECLPIGRKQEDAHGLAGQPQPVTRLVPQVNYDFYAKPSAPKTTILSCSANPLQRKRTTIT